MFETSKPEELRETISAGKWAVLFTTTWCPQCRVFEPKFKKYEGKVSGISFARIIIDLDENPAWDEYRITSVPTAALFENGKEVSRAECDNVGLREEAFKKLLGL
jgi:thioredoxin-like negative regulator of GroEL